jgi:hypothetical protein
MTSKAPTLDVRLSNPDENAVALNAVAVPPPPGYYVIVGRGASAWYNHATLLQTPWGRQRMSLGNALLPVMHIGYEEPWSRRGGERMGQPPRFLDFFRGLGNLGLAGGLDQGDWLPASAFARTVRDAEQYVSGFYSDVQLTDGNYRLLYPGPGLRDTSLVIRNGFVGLIQRQVAHPGALPAPEQTRANATTASDDPAVWANPACPYRLSVYHHRVRRFVYAHKIDICTGPGQARLLDRALFATQDLYDEHLPVRDEIPEIRPADQGFPRILDGNEYIGSPNDRDKSVLVFKGNPVGAQSVQSAMDMPHVRDGQRARRVWWVISEDVRARNPADVPGRRNLLEIVGNSPLQDGEAAAITTNHGALWATQLARHNAFRNKLHRLGWHEIQQIAEGTPGAPHGTRFQAVPGIKCSFSFHPYGNPATPIRPAAPAGAAQSVLDLFRECAPSVPGAAEGLEIAPQGTTSPRSRALLEAVAAGEGITWAQLAISIQHASVEQRAALVTRAENWLEKQTGMVARYVRNLQVRIHAPFHPHEGTGPRAQAEHDLEKVVGSLKSAQPNPTPFLAYLQLSQRGQIDRLVQAIGDAPSDDDVEPMIVEASGPMRAEVRQLVEVVAIGNMARSITTDLLVYSLGQERGRAAEGTVLYMTQQLGNLGGMFHPGSGFAMALTDTRADAEVGAGWGRVRVLGAAILSGPTDGTEAAFNASHVQHGATLPQEGPAGGGGYNLAMTNIRRANQFLPVPARLSTFSQGELVTSGLSAGAAAAVIATRSATDRGYTPAEYALTFAALGLVLGLPLAVDAVLLTLPGVFSY